MKYKLTNETKKRQCRTLYRIQALKEFGVVKAHEFGGWVESERNLSQEGNCWVFDNAQVCGDAVVSGDAVVGTHEKSQVSEFNFSILPSEVEEVVIAGVRYKKETTWKKI